MRKLMPALALLSVAVASATLTLYVSSIVRGEDTLPPAVDGDGFLTNERFIRGLYEERNLGNAREVFEYIFSRLDHEILLYPTENYYYFTFPSNGKVIWGSLHLPAYRLDEGVLGFGYIEKGYNVHETRRVGGSGNYTSAHGVEIEKVSDFRYSITFEGKTVIFKLNELDLGPPREARLTDSEVLVEPMFDESGLKFFLVFNQVTNRLYWLLNEDGYVPESFTPYGENIIIGNRIGFAFYVDEENNRKLLIGVYGPNVMTNNWHDGPFDQLLDNYHRIGKVEIREYIEAFDPTTVGKIDKYGNYLDSVGTRVAIAPYSTYFYEDDLVALVAACSGAATQDQLNSCITQENHDSLLDPPYP